MGRPERLTAKGERSRTSLMRAAAAVMAETGYAGVTHRAVAERAGVSVGTTTYFFSSIDQLVLETSQHFQERAVERFEVVFKHFVRSLERPDEGCRAVATLLLSVPAQQLLCNFEVYLNASRELALRPVAIGTLTRFEHLAEAFLVKIGATEPGRGARALVALCDGFLVHRLVRQTPDDAGELERALRNFLIPYLMSDAERAPWEARLSQVPGPVGTP